MIENNIEKPEEKKKGFGKKFIVALFDFLKVAVIAALIVLPIRYFLFQPFIVKGESMTPNFQSGDYLIVDEFSYKISNPQRGDVIVLKYPLDTKQRFIKRIIGLPGETIEIEDGKITIISREGLSSTLNEKGYLANLKKTDGDLKITLLDKEFFVLGDNRPFSYDSRRWGALPKEDIVGRVTLRVFPLTSIIFLSSPSY